MYRLQPDFTMQSYTYPAQLRMILATLTSAHTLMYTFQYVPVHVYHIPRSVSRVLEQ